MNRVLVVVAVLATLVLPMVAGADETFVPPEANWSAVPPARPTIDAVQLVDVLVKKGVLSPVDQASLMHSPVVRPKIERREMDRYNGFDVTSQP